MDCDDIAVLLAGGEARTLTSVEDRQLHDHLAACETCEALAGRGSVQTMRTVAKAPDRAFDGARSFFLPTVDPIVFQGSKQLAQGGMGRVVRARDRRLDREVALKEVLDPAYRARFEREVAITAKLQHPAIIPIYEAGQWPDGTAFFAMRLVSGGTLAEAITRARTLEQRLALLPHVLALADALAYAHARRIVHRDLKPGNVLVGEFGETVVIDWGLAKDLDADGDDAAITTTAAHSDLTLAGAVMGTPGFMAPEQASGADLDERCDVYALGAILYNLLAGHPPHYSPETRPTPSQLIEAARSGPARPIRELAPGAPADLHAIIDRAIAYDRGARFASAQELAEELRRFQAGQLLRSRAYGVRELVARWIRRHRAAVAVGGIAAAALIALAVASVIGITRSRDAERTARHHAEHALAESQLEQGRQILIGGNPDAAAPLLAAASARLPDDRIARRLLAIAQRDGRRRLGGFAGTTAAFRPDGGELAIGGGGDGTITIVDPATGTTLRTLPAAGGGGIAHLTYTHDGASVLVAAASGCTLRAARTGAVTTAFGAAPATDARVVESGRVVVAGRDELRLYAPDGALLHTTAMTAPRILAVSRDGARLAAITGDAAVVISAHDLARLAELPRDGEQLFDLALAPDGELVTAGGGATRRWTGEPLRTGRAYGLRTGRAYGLRTGRAYGLRELARYPAATSLAWLDDTMLVAGSRVIDTRSGAVRALGLDPPVQAAAALDRGHVITGGYDRLLRIWDVERGMLPIAIVTAASATSAFMIDPAGRRAASIGRSGDAPIELWDVTRLPAPAPLATVAGRIDRLVSDRAGRLVVRWQGAGGTGTELFGTSHEHVASLTGWPMGFRPGADEVVTDQDGRLIVASSRDGHTLREVTAAQPIYHLAFSRSGARAATSSDRHVDLRDAQSWQILAGFEAAADITALALDEADRIVTGHRDGAIRIWDARTGRLLRLLAGHAAYVGDLEIRGATLVSGSWDLTTRMWAFPSGEPLTTLTSATRLVSGVAMSPDGQLIAVADGSTAVKVWDAARGRLLEQVPTTDEVASVAFSGDDHVVVGGATGRLELVELARSR